MSVYGCPRPAFGETRSQKCVAPNIESLVTHLRDGSGDDIVDQGRIERGARDQLGKAVRQQVGWRDIPQRPAGLLGLRTAPTTTASRPVLLCMTSY